MRFHAGRLADDTARENNFSPRTPCRLHDQRFHCKNIHDFLTICMPNSAHRMSPTLNFGFRRDVYYWMA